MFLFARNNWIVEICQDRISVSNAAKENAQWTLSMTFVKPVNLEVEVKGNRKHSNLHK